MVKLMALVANLSLINFGFGLLLESKPMDMLFPILGLWPLITQRYDIMLSNYVSS